MCDLIYSVCYNHISCNIGQQYNFFKFELEYASENQWESALLSYELTALDIVEFIFFSDHERNKKG